MFDQETCSRVAPCDGVAVPEMPRLVCDVVIVPPVAGCVIEIAGLVAGALRLSRNVLDTPPIAAVNNALWSAETDATLTVTEALVALAGMATTEGTVTFRFALDIVADSPPAGAEPLRVNVQRIVPDPVTVAGLHARLRSWTDAVTATCADFVTPPKLALTVMVLFAVTTPATPVTETVVAPLGTVTDAGMVSAASLLESATTTPLPDAAFVSITMQVVLWP